jgi:heme/copper-type cytochrome/quinol oxidase subunit 3
VSEFAASSTEYEVVEGEPPELLGRNLVSAGHLFTSASAFFFLAFVFAYFYLRSLNNAGMFQPKHVDASVGWGTAVMVLTVLSAGLVRLGLADQRAGRRAQWRTKGLLALLLGIASIVVQVIEWTAVDFGPASGGYASVFYGWTAFMVLFAVGAMFWLETLVATAYRYRNQATSTVPPGEASGDADRTGSDIANPLTVIRPGLEAFSFFWTFLAGVTVLAWVVLYLI